MENLFIRKYCIDALSSVGTREAFQVLKKKIQEKKINKAEELKQVFLGMSSAPRPSANHIRVTWVRLQLISMTQPSQNKLWRSIYCYKLRLYFVTSSRTKLWCFKNILIPCPLIVCSDFFNSKIRIRRSSFWLF